MFGGHLFEEVLRQIKGLWARLSPGLAVALAVEVLLIIGCAVLITHESLLDFVCRLVGKAEGGSFIAVLIFAVVVLYMSLRIIRDVARHENGSPTAGGRSSAPPQAPRRTPKGK